MKEIEKESGLTPGEHRNQTRVNALLNAQQKMGRLCSFGYWGSFGPCQRDQANSTSDWVLQRRRVPLHFVRGRQGRQRGAVIRLSYRICQEKKEWRERRQAHGYLAQKRRLKRI